MIKKLNLIWLLAISTGIVASYWILDFSNLLLSLFSLTFFLVCPGYILKKLLRINHTSKIQLAGIVLGISIFFYYILGFFLNLVGLSLDFKHPLDPIITRIVSIWFIVPAGIYILKSKMVYIKWGYTKNNILLIFFSFSLLLFSIISTIYLNYGNNTLIYFSISILIISLIVIIHSLASFTVTSLGIYLFCVALSLIFSYSLRSNYLIGWDIHQEFLTYQLTNINHSWVYSIYKNAYNACLSITILPKILIDLTKFDQVIFFKIFYNLVFAFVPVLIFDKIAQVYDKKTAFFSVLPFILLTWFFEQFPSLSRQEMSFLFLALSFILMLSKEKLSRNNFFLLYIFGLSLVISHYSTAYLWVVLILVVYCLKLITNFLKHTAFLENLNLYYVLFVLLTTVFWYNIIFPTTKGIGGTLIEVGAEYSKSSFQDKLSYTIQKIQFRNNKLSDQSQIFQSYLIDKSNSKSYESDKYSIDTNYSYSPELIYEQEIPSKLNDNFSLFLLKIASFTKIVVVIIFPFGGGVVLFNRFVKNKMSVSQTNLLLFGLASLIVLTLALLIPNLEKEYSITRLYSQLLIFNSVLFAIFCMSIYTLRFKLGSFAISFLLLVYSTYSTELIFQFTGGPSSILYNNYGSAYNQYYTFKSDALGAIWLKNQNISSKSVQSDIMASLRLKAYGLIDNTDYEIFPDTLRMSKYLFLYSTNVLKYVTYRKYEGVTYAYKIPLEFINEKKDLIYSNGNSQVYK